MYDFIMAEDNELWDVIRDGPYVPTMLVKVWKVTLTSSKQEKEFDDTNRKKIDKNFKAKKLFVCGIGPNEYNRIFVCESAKEMWECLKTAHERTS